MGVGSIACTTSSATENSVKLTSINVAEPIEKAAIKVAESNEKASNACQNPSSKESDAIGESNGKLLKTRDCVTRKGKYRNYISAKLRRTLLNRSGYQCCYTDSNSGRRCEQRHGLQIEHRVPLALGGSDSLENLEILCSTHNKLRAVQKLGVTKMRRYISSLS